MRQLGVFIGFILVLNACATIEKPSTEDATINKQAAWELHRINLEAIQAWSLKGRIAGKSNSEGFRAGVHWKQQESNFNIDMHGPLGRKVAELIGDESNVQLNTSKGERFSASNPESLMQELFGYSLPIYGLQYWMRGIPDPEQAYASLELDDQGRLKQLHQAGWVIDYDRYHAGNPELPAFIKISSATLNANVKIDKWNLNFSM